MKRKVLILLALSLALVLGITQIASATGWGMGGGRLGDMSMMGGGKAELNSENWTSPAEKLNLTDEQSQQLKDLHKSNYEATKDMRAQLQNAMFELKQLGFDKNPDKAAVDAKIQEINNLRTQLNQVMQQNRESMQNILTPEQQEQMKSMKGKCRPGGRGMGEAKDQAQ